MANKNFTIKHSPDGSTFDTLYPETTLEQVNGLQTALDTKENADVTILKQANVVDNVTSTVVTAPLSANQGKLLSDRINNLESVGRFLSVWNCTTGKPETEPSTLPYDYHSGDYFRVGQVGSTNYKPNGSQYTGAASTTQETGEVHSGDIYYYDSSAWTLMATHSGDFVSEVKVNGTSVVSAGVANVTAVQASDLEIETVVPINADTLGGQLPTFYSPTYPQDTTQDYVLALKYENNNWVKYWKAQPSSSNVVGTGQVGYMVI